MYVCVCASEWQKRPFLIETTVTTRSFAYSSLRKTFSINKSTANKIKIGCFHRSSTWYWVSPMLIFPDAVERKKNVKFEVQKINFVLFVHSIPLLFVGFDMGIKYSFSRKRLNLVVYALFYVLLRCYVFDLFIEFRCDSIGQPHSISHSNYRFVFNWINAGGTIACWHPTRVKRI